MHFTIAYSSVCLSVRTLREERLRGTRESSEEGIPEIRHLPYRERLKACKLPTLHFTQVTGVMIEMYKILTGKYDVDVTPKPQYVQTSN